MRNIIITFILTICAATTLPAQFVQGTLQGGPPAPGTKSRSPLNSLERAASNRYGATIMTDSFGNQRFTYYVHIWDTCLTYNPQTAPVVGGPISVFVRKCETDSIWYIDYNNDVFFLGVTSGGGGPVENWYTVDDTTTDATRTAYILENAYWYGLDPSGNILFSIGDVSVSDFSISASEFYASHSDLGGLNGTSINATGIDIFSSNTASRAVDITTDTMNWASSFDPTFMSINYRADATYMYADSLKVFGIGQFESMDFDPILHPNGAQKGFYYSPFDGNGVWMINGEGISGAYSYTRANSTSTDIKSTFVNGTYDYTDNGITSGSSQISASIIENNSGSNYNETASVDLDNVKWNLQINDATAFGDTQTYFQAYQNSDPGRDIKYAAFGEIRQSGVTAINASSYLGRASSNGTEQRAKSNRMAWGVQQYEPGGTYLFDWLKIDLYDTISTKDAIQFYNDRYRWQNAEPSPTVGDTSFHFWAGIGSGTTNPGFMTLAQIQAGIVNWYNSNGTTTDNTRIATVTETATWLSSDGDLDGVFPFRFELADASPNEPEMMVWKFPTDSATLYQSDQEIGIRSTNALLNRADAYYAIWADSVFYQANGVTAYKIGAYNTETQFSAGSGNKQNLIENRNITGTAQTELFLDGSSAVLTLPSNSANNFEIHVSAICSAAGNGIGITTGESFASWHVGGIKRIVNTTALVGTVQTTATAQSDAGMSTSVVTIDANDTNDSLRIRFTPPSTAGTTTVIKVIATIEFTQTSY